jgi:hypothetical protein
MAFNTRRGRPPKAAGSTDSGTPELRFKHAHGLTMEPIDYCLDRRAITPAQHWCGLHLRWLYTLRYGAPSLTTRYDTESHSAPKNADDPQWRRQREAEYHEATALLRSGLHYEPVMRLCVFNEMPVFMNAALRERAWEQPAMARRLAVAQHCLTEGLELLAGHWKRR